VGGKRRCVLHGELAAFLRVVQGRCGETWGKKTEELSTDLGHSCHLHAVRFCFSLTPKPDHVGLPALENLLFLSMISLLLAILPVTC